MPLPVLNEIPDDIVDALLDFEGDKMEEPEIVDFFQMLIDTGLAKKFKGKYMTVAKELILSGHCKVNCSEQEKVYA